MIKLDREAVVYLGPGNKDSQLHLADGELTQGDICQNTIHHEYKELYYLSATISHEVQEGLCYLWDDGEVKRATKSFKLSDFNYRWAREVIATTDTSLWLNATTSNFKGPVYRIARISQHFLDTYIDHHERGETIHRIWLDSLADNGEVVWKFLHERGYLEIDGETYLHRNFVVRDFVPRFIKRMLTDGRIKVVKGQEEYFKFIDGAPTTIFDEFLTEDKTVNNE